MADTPNLDLPFISPDQGQKHVTHNEALNRLDTLTQLAVVDRTRTAPPESATEGQRFIVAASATGSWNGQDKNIAAFQDGVWQYYQPRSGWRALVIAEQRVVYFSGTEWVNIAGGGSGSDLAAQQAAAAAHRQAELNRERLAVGLRDVTEDDGSTRVELGTAVAVRGQSINANSLPFRAFDESARAQLIGTQLTDLEKLFLDEWSVSETPKSNTSLSGVSIGGFSGVPPTEPSLYTLAVSTSGTSRGLVLAQTDRSAGLSVPDTHLVSEVKWRLVRPAGQPAQPFSSRGVTFRTIGRVEERRLYRIDVTAASILPGNFNLELSMAGGEAEAGRITPSDLLLEFFDARYAMEQVFENLRDLVSRIRTVQDHSPVHNIPQSVVSWLTNKVAIEPDVVTQVPTQLNRSFSRNDTAAFVAQAGTVPAAAGGYQNTASIDSQAGSKIGRKLIYLPTGGVAEGQIMLKALQGSTETDLLRRGSGNDRTRIQISHHFPARQAGTETLTRRPYPQGQTPREWWVLNTEFGMLDEVRLNQQVPTTATTVTIRYRSLQDRTEGTVFQTTLANVGGASTVEAQAVLSLDTGETIDVYVQWRASDRRLSIGAIPHPHNRNAFLTNVEVAASWTETVATLARDAGVEWLDAATFTPNEAVPVMMAPTTGDRGAADQSQISLVTSLRNVATGLKFNDAFGTVNNGVLRVFLGTASPAPSVDVFDWDGAVTMFSRRNMETLAQAVGLSYRGLYTVRTDHRAVARIGTRMEVKSEQDVDVPVIGASLETYRSTANLSIALMHTNTPTTTVQYLEFGERVVARSRDPAFTWEAVSNSFICRRKGISTFHIYQRPSITGIRRITSPNTELVSVVAAEVQDVDAAQFVVLADSRRDEPIRSNIFESTNFDSAHRRTFYTVISVGLSVGQRIRFSLRHDLDGSDFDGTKYILQPGQLRVDIVTVV